MAAHPPLTRDAIARVIEMVECSLPGDIIDVWYSKAPLHQEAVTRHMGVTMEYLCEALWSSPRVLDSPENEVLQIKCVKLLLIGWPRTEKLYLRLIQDASKRQHRECLSTLAAMLEFLPWEVYRLSKAQRDRIIEVSGEALFNLRSAKGGADFNLAESMAGYFPLTPRNIHHLLGAANQAQFHGVRYAAAHAISDHFHRFSTSQHRLLLAQLDFGDSNRRCRYWKEELREKLVESLRRKPRGCISGGEPK